MKMLFIGDIHFKDTGLIPYFSEVEDNGVSRELNRAIKSLKWVEKEIRKNKPDLVVQLGDIFHTLNQVSSNVLIEAFKSIQSLHNVVKEVGAELYIIGGNHDYVGMNKYTSEILPCDRFFNKEETIIINNKKFTFLPYYDPEYKMWYRIQVIESDFVITHTQVKNSFYNRVRKAETGLDVDTLEKDKIVISGHIHIPQQIGNVYYTGSLYQNTFSEQPIDLPFGITLVDIKDEVKFNQIDNNSVDKFITINDNNFEETLLSLEEIENYYIKLITNDKKKIEELKEYTNKFIVVPEYKQQKERQKEYNVDYDNLNTKNLIKEYIKDNYPYLNDKVKKIIGE